MTEKRSPFEHQVHNDEQEFIAGFNQPTAAEQAKARESMTDEQKEMSKEREAEYERQRRENEFPLMADIRTITAYRGADHGHSEKEFGDKGYSRQERLWISDDGKIYFRQELDAKNTGVFDSKFIAGQKGDTKRHNAEELSPERALGKIKLSKEFAETSIKSLERKIQEFKALQDRLKVAEERINSLPKSGEPLEHS